MQHANVITTYRLTLRQLSPADARFLAMLLRAPDVRRYLGGALDAATCDTVIAGYLTQAETAPNWIALNDKTPCGLISLTPHKDGADTELSYQFDPRQWGKGYGTEAGRAVIDHGLTALGLPRIIAETQAANLASVRLLQRLEMHETARIMRFGAQQVIYTTKDVGDVRSR